jgi:tyrosinase
MGIRKSARNLLPNELDELRRASGLMMNITDNRGYEYMAGIHGIPQFKCKHGESGTISDPNFRLFLPWHRAYLYWFEKYLQDAAGNSMITIPWWDWSSALSRSEGIPKAYSDATVYGAKNPLFSYHVKLPDWVDLTEFNEQTGCQKPMEYDTHREPLSPSQLPTPQEVEAVLSKSDYGDFSDGLEDIHNFLHGWVGGTCGDMSYVPFSAFDPIFWSHHCMIDRLFWLWQLRPGHNLPLTLYNEVLDPFNLTVKQVINIYELGYDYASQQILVGGNIS